jgi:hypothetical protein
MRLARTSAALVAALLLAACPRSQPKGGPVPIAMTPPEGTGLSPVPVVIAGNGFDASASTDFSQGSAQVNATFTARLLRDGGGAAVALEAVRLTSERRLEASVPAGIARGGYALEVIDPAGRVGTLQQAFRVVSAPENVDAFRVEPAEPATAGVPFLVTLTAVDASGTTVDGFTGTVTLSDLSGTLSPAVSGPFVLGQLPIRLTVQAVTPADRMTVSDALGHVGTSPDFAVSPGPAVAVAFPGGPLTAAAGACTLVTLQLRDAQGNPAAAVAAVDVALQTSPVGGLAFHAGGACGAPVTNVTISPGSSATTFRVQGAAPGAYVARALPAGLPSATLGVTLTP